MPTNNNHHRSNNSRFDPLREPQSSPQYQQPQQHINTSTQSTHQRYHITIIIVLLQTNNQDNRNHNHHNRNHYCNHHNCNHLSGSGSNHGGMLTHHTSLLLILPCSLHPSVDVITSLQILRRILLLDDRNFRI